MRFSQYEMTKEACCECSSPYEISTERDWCQACKKPIYEPTWTEYLKKKLDALLEEYGVSKSSASVIRHLMKEHIECIWDHRDADKAQKKMSEVKRILEET